MLSCNNTQFLLADQLCAPMHRINLAVPGPACRLGTSCGISVAVSTRCGQHLCEPSLSLLLHGDLPFPGVKELCGLRVSVGCVSREPGAHWGALGLNELVFFFCKVCTGFTMGTV